MTTVSLVGVWVGVVVGIMILTDVFSLSGFPALVIAIIVFFAFTAAAVAIDHLVFDRWGLFDART